IRAILRSMSTDVFSMSFFMAVPPPLNTRRDGRTTAPPPALSGLCGSLLPLASSFLESWRSAPRGGDHFRDGPTNGVYTLHSRLPPGLHLLDDAGDAPGRVTGQADYEGHHRALDRDNLSLAMWRMRRPSATHTTLLYVGVVDEPSLGALK